MSSDHRNLEVPKGDAGVLRPGTSIDWAQVEGRPLKTLARHLLAEVPSLRAKTSPTVWTRVRIPGVGQLNMEVLTAALSDELLADLRSSLELAEIHETFVREFEQDLAQDALGRFRPGYRIEYEKRQRRLEEELGRIRTYLDAVCERLVVEHHGTAPRRGAAPRPAAPAESCKILFLSANPEGTHRLALDDEIREIELKVQATEYRSDVHLISNWAVRPDDLLQSLNRHRPQIVHFSGHGSPGEELVLHDSAGAPKTVGKEALVSLFTTLKDNIRIVVLNACYSKPQAAAIVETIDCAIGMKSVIPDQAAITFAAAFYRAIGFGRSVQDAFDQGLTALLLEGVPGEEVPELWLRDGVDASQIFLLGSRQAEWSSRTEE